MHPLPLHGVRVLDITAVIGAPYGTGMLAQMGAEVIRVESLQNFPSTTRGNMARPLKEMVPSMGPVGRSYPDFDPGERPWNRFGLFNCHAHNKLSMTVDLRRSEGITIFHDLLRVSDILVENLPGVMPKLGLEYTALRRVQPDLVMVSVSGMGGTGPYKDNRGYGSHFEDVMGHAWMRGYPDDHPRANTSAVASDPAAGAALAWAAAAALHYRRRTGKGQHIDLSMAETYLHHLGSAFMDYTMNRRVQRTVGNRHQFCAPHGCYPSLGDDKWVTIAVRDDGEWGSLRRKMGNPTWARQPKFDTAYGRLRGQDEIDLHLAEWTRGYGHIELQSLLQEAGVAAGAVLSAKEIFRDPHLRARGFYESVTQADAGTHDYGFRWWQMNKTPMESRNAPPLLGEHNSFVYKELLGIQSERYAYFEQGRHIGMDYDPNIR